MIVLAETDSNSQHIDAVRSVNVSKRIFSFRREVCTTSLQGNFLVPSHLLARACSCVFNNSLLVLLSSEFSQGRCKGGGKYA